ncbi:uncharacterized protein LOC127809395 [Diospyros lotus]|uniref:uncharacterized protein LOC127809395 n=1 Tax=Diospyros lotus TaxID=55363 RepID=UPI00224D3988|nr:uncharacterized protein LOC127809395 [Diospyros lotus]
MSEVPPERFHIPSIKLCDGSTDPYDHVELFSSHMLVQSGFDEMWCRAFSTTLGGYARTWYSCLPHHFINSWEELKTCFLAHYAPLKGHQKSSMALVNIKQNQGESLRDFVARFNEEALSIDEFDQRIAMVALQNGLRAGPFAQSLAKTLPRTFTEALTRANKYINAEEVMKVKRVEQPDKKEREKEKKKSVDKNYLRRPPPLKSPLNTRSKKRYCRFHRDHDHETEDCIQLKEEIQELINRGYLRDFISRGGVNSGKVESQPEQRRKSPTRDRFRERSRTPPQREGKQPAEEGGHKFILYTLAAGTVPGPHSTAPKSVVKEKVVIAFSEEDLPSYPNYSDPLMITAQVGEWEMRRILVHPGSFLEILYKRAFLGMGFTLDQLRPVRVPLVGFDGMVIHFEGLIRLPLTVSSGSHKSQVTLDFLVADVPSAYNMILGRFGLSALRAVPSTYHMVLKFPTLGGIGKVRGVQRQARECYVAFLSATIAKGSESDSRPNQDAIPQEVRAKWDETGKSLTYRSRSEIGKGGGTESCRSSHGGYQFHLGRSGGAQDLGAGGRAQGSLARGRARSDNVDQFQVTGALAV